MYLLGYPRSVAMDLLQGVLVAGRLISFDALCLFTTCPSLLSYPSLAIYLKRLLGVLLLSYRGCSTTLIFLRSLLIYFVPLLQSMPDAIDSVLWCLIVDFTLVDVILVNPFWLIPSIPFG
jgi:hypothetical protein